MITNKGFHNYTISGSAAGHNLANFGGLILGASNTVTLTGTPNFSWAFAIANGCGACSVYAVIYSGGATGARYAAALNGVLQTFGGGANYFPGNAAGSVATGGQYA